MYSNVKKMLLKSGLDEKNARCNLNKMLDFMFPTSPGFVALL